VVLSCLYLTIYSTFFNSIEVNASFYKIPQQKTVERWSLSVPDSFRFTFKLHQDVTHVRALYYGEDRVMEFVNTIQSIGIKRACILVQFPPSLKANSLSQLEQLLASLHKSYVDFPFNIAVEFRDPSWYNEDTYALLEHSQASMVLQDIPKSAAPIVLTSSAFVYVRFHGPTGNYRGSYTDAFLQEYTEYIHDWLNSGRQVYIYFNNTAGSAFENARTLRKFLNPISGK
jgi:uncharacterized protein YecE (DUF72 family)